MKDKQTKKKKRKGWIILLVCLLLLIGTGFYQSRTNPRVRMLLSIMKFSESTLKSEDYLLHNIDIMELCRTYINGDTHVVGDAGFSHMKNLASSISMDIDRTRSFASRRMVNKMQMNFLWMKAGEIDVYGENETIYLDAPLLGDDIGYAFPTGIDLFMKAPDLTSDINQKWFRSNAKNIVQLMGEIEIKKTGKTYTDKDGLKGEEFVVTIPKGSGAFVWKLFGMDMPDYDVVYSVYLTKNNQLIRMEVDASHVIDGVSMVMQGKNLGTAYMYYQLPDNEKAVMRMKRNAKEDCLDCTMVYYANTGENIKMKSSISWTKRDKGFSLKINNIHMWSGEEEMAQGFFKGEVTPLKDAGDVFEGKDERLYGFEVLDWKAIRKDTKGFVNDVLSKTSFGAFVAD